jgi:hypothetical protein
MMTTGWSPRSRRSGSPGSKGDGLRFPAEAVSECLAQAGLGAGRIEAVAMSRSYYPQNCFTARSCWPAPVPRGEVRHLFEAMTRQWIRDPERAFDPRRFSPTKACGRAE